MQATDCCLMLIYSDYLTNNWDFSSFCYRLILACHISFPPKIFLCSFRNSLRWIHKYLLSFSLSRKKNITNNSTYFNFKYQLQLLVLVLFYFSILYPMQPDFKQLVCVYHWKQFRGDKTPIPIISTAKKFNINQQSIILLKKKSNPPLIFFPHFVGQLIECKAWPLLLDFISDSLSCFVYLDDIPLHR